MRRGSSSLAGRIGLLFVLAVLLSPACTHARDDQATSTTEPYSLAVQAGPSLDSPQCRAALSYSTSVRQASNPDDRAGSQAGDPAYRQRMSSALARFEKEATEGGFAASRLSSDVHVVARSYPADDPGPGVVVTFSTADTEAAIRVIEWMKSFCGYSRSQTLP